MKRIQILSLITTVLNWIVASGCFLFSGISFWILCKCDALIQDNAAIVNNTSGSSMGGLIPILSLFGILLGEIGKVVFYAAAILLLILAVVYCIPSVMGLVLNAKARQSIDNHFEKSCKAWKTDAIIKIIFNAVPAVLLFAGLFSGSFLSLWYDCTTLLFLGSFVASIIQLVCIKQYI